MQKQSLTLNLFIKGLSKKLGLKFSDFDEEFGPKTTNVTMFDKKKRVKSKRFNQSKVVRSFSYQCNEYILQFLELTENEIELYWIEVKCKRCKGYGTELMNKILNVCDDLNIKLKAIPCDFDNPNCESNLLLRLREWYRSFGFKKKSYLDDVALYYFPNS